ncbi:hypothetical protein NHX12_010707 [Muraenolepis orangiensis]|uniref:SAND domain-containing protein n=1 Tax=Muraenolepis orangiensis TaxID=630683 RepID=A0A9Q0DKB4_9TELE|nr:hypothetical protein NHX12_010707 [Muraenolepis orangiensis]
MDAESSGADVLLKQEAETVFVKLTEEVDVESDIFYPITCGDTKAILFNEQLVSPKEFVCLAGKSTLKDWKRAIRLNGTMLRKIMDSGQLEFYQHAKVCSNTCRSTKIDLVGGKVSVSSQRSAECIAFTPSSSATILNGQSQSFSEPEESSEWVTAIGEDSVVFWCGVKQAGLLDEVVNDFQKELTQMLKSLHERVLKPPLANFGMLDLVKKVLASHKSQMDHYREQYTQSLAALEQQCDEHRKRAKEMKSKAQHLDDVLMTLSPAPSPPAPKHPRLSRCISAPTVVCAAPPAGQMTLSLSQLSQLSGLQGGLKVFTMAGNPVAGANLSGYTVLTSPAAGGVAERSSDRYPSNLTVLSTAAGVQEGNGTAMPLTFLKVLGPQYQLVTLPPGMLGGALGGTLALTHGATGPVGSTCSVNAVAVRPPQVVAQSFSEVSCFGDLQKVAVETESEGDQEC